MLDKFQKSSSGIIGLLLIVAILFSSKYASGASTKPLDHEQLMAALDQAGVEAKQFVFQQSGLVYRNQTNEKLMKLAGKSEETFGVELSLKDTSQNEVIRYEGRKDLTRDTELQIAWVGKKEQGDPARPRYSVYLVIEISSTDAAEWKSYYSYLHSGLTDLGIKAEINSSIQGIIPSKMSLEEQNEFVRELFSKLDAEITEGVSLDSMVSLSGYSNKLHRTIKHSDGKINLQLATRAVAAESYTMVTIGNPIIVMEY